MSTIDVLGSIAASNAGRRPEVLAQKYALMRTDPFSFYRGTAPLFAADWTANAPPALTGSPVGWLCGDAHLENFGTYRARRGLVVFDVNDFDETWLGPVLYDVARLAVASMVWRRSRDARADPVPSVTALVDAYADALLLGKPLWIDRDVATGEIKRLMQAVFDRDYVTVLDKRTTVDGKKRKLALGKRALAVDDDQRRRATAAIAAFAKTTGDPPTRYDVVDVAWRIAGTGSLGLERYIVLIAGDGTTNGMRLMDVKFAAPAALAGRLDVAQPAWSSDAERVVGGYRRLQARTPNRIGAVAVDGRSFVVRTLQPTEDKLDWSDPKKLDVEDLHASLGGLVAWAQLRSGGRDGSAIADAMIAFGNDRGWRAPLVEHAVAAAQRFQAYWDTFRSSQPPRLALG